MNETAWISADGDLFIGENETNCDFVADASSVALLREFFRAEEDERLGRWRWPEDPAYVVYPEGEAARVMSERSGMNWYPIHRSTDATGRQYIAARAYFDAHPEPKPWHDAKPGEVWVLDANEYSGPHYVEDNDNHFVGGLGFRHVITRDRGPGITAAYVKNAHRIYPEGS